MLDPAVMQALETPLPPEPSRVVEERIWLSQGAEEANKLGNAVLGDFERRLTDWLDSVKTLETRLSATVAEGNKATPSDILHFDNLIQRLEFLAETRTRHRERGIKKGKRLVKELFEEDPSLGATVRAAFDRLALLDKAAIKALLDHALFLRAMRTGALAEKRVSDRFDTGSEFLAHFKKRLAGARVA